MCGIHVVSHYSCVYSTLTLGLQRASGALQIYPRHHSLPDYLTRRRNEDLSWQYLNMDWNFLRCKIHLEEKMCAQGTASSWGKLVQDIHLAFLGLFLTHLIVERTDIPLMRGSFYFSALDIFRQTCISLFPRNLQT